ncbi:MAG: glycosyltransferase family 39 protein [candidate division Zixibacteria bacterium]|nr:glycosyltransferase family 39 protein [candidate division Zixibacteria bacterium]
MGNQGKSSLWWLIPAALAIKLAYLFFAYPEASSVGALSIDALYHYKWAMAIASGDIFVNAPYFRAPLYPFVLAGLLKISGGSLIFVRVVQMLLGCLMLAVVYRLTEKIFNRLAATLAVLLLALYPLTTYFEGELLLDSLFALLALLSLYFLLTRRKGKDRPVTSGIFFALAALTRPTILVFLPIAAGYYYLHKKGSTERKTRLQTAGVFVAVVIVLLIPVAVVNYIHSGQIILVSYQGGVNFYIGNNSQADGLSSNLPPFGADWTLDDARYAAMAETGRNLTYNDLSSYWYRKGISFALSDPTAFGALMVKKIYYLFSGHEISDNRPLDEAVFANKFLRLLPVRLPMIVAAAVLSLFLVRRHRNRFLYLYGIVAVYGLTIAAFFVNSRFRLPLVPLLAIFAGIGLASLYDVIRQRAWNLRLALALISAVAVYVLATANLCGGSLTNPSQALFLRGNASLRQGDYSAAAARFDSLSQMTPYFDNNFLNLGIAFLKLGRSDEAAQAFRRELDHNPRSAEAANNLGVLFLLGKEYDSTLTYCGQALENKPYYQEAAVNFLRAGSHSADSQTVRRIEKQRDTMRPYFQDDPQYFLEEGLYLAAHGRLQAAIDDQLRAVELSLDRKQATSFEFSHDLTGPGTGANITALACYQLGYLYGLSADFANSVVYSRKAIAADPRLKEAYINLVSGYRSQGDGRRADSVIAVFRSLWPSDR